MTKKPKRTLVGKLTHPPAQKYKPKRACGAATRAGHPCTRPALPGKTRCKLHGGKSTGPTDPTKMIGNTSGKVGRLYGAGMTPAELEWLNSADKYAGTLAKEIEVLRVALFRATICQKIWLEHKGILARMEDKAPMEDYMREHGLWDEIRVNNEVGTAWDTEANLPVDINKKRVERRQRDYSTEIMKITDKINKLELTHQQLINSQQGGEDVSQLAEDLRLFYDNAAAMMPGGGPDAAEEGDNG